MQFGGEGKKKRGGGIQHVSSLFDKYAKTLKAPQGTVITTFIAVVEKNCNATLTKEQCSYAVHSKTITLRVSGMIKTEIILKKKAILSDMAALLGSQSAPKEIL